MSMVCLSEVQEVNPPHFLFKCKICAKDNENYKGERNYDEAERHDMRHKSEKRLEKYRVRWKKIEYLCSRMNSNARILFGYVDHVASKLEIFHREMVACEMKSYEMKSFEMY